MNICFRLSQKILWNCQAKYNVTSAILYQILNWSYVSEDSITATHAHLMAIKFIIYGRNGKSTKKVVYARICVEQKWKNA